MLKKEKANDPTVYDYWPSCKKKVLTGNVLKRMKEYEKDNVDVALVEKMTPLIATPAFTDAALKNAGRAALGIGNWCKAIIEYDTAMKVVKPKKIELAAAK